MDGGSTNLQLKMEAASAVPKEAMLFSATSSYITIIVLLNSLFYVFILSTI
uniref:Uncharacterized protein n=1 Tax=Solanum lycopersicum TaxID=4081 RepID=K4CKJ1_SOLLC